MLALDTHRPPPLLSTDMPTRYITLPPREPQFGNANHVDYLVRQRDPDPYESVDDMVLEVQTCMEGKRRVRLEKVVAHIQRVMKLDKKSAESIVEQVITTPMSLIFKQRVYKDGGYDFYTYNETNEEHLRALAIKQEKAYAKKHAEPPKDLFD